MKFQQTARFRSDRADLADEHFGLFWTTVRDSFIPAAERRATEPGTPWPGGLRVKSVKGAPGSVGDDVELRRSGRTRHV